MNKLLKLTGVSILAIMAAANANAAGYTCEELIEYTSCNPGYYLGDATCPDDYEYIESACLLENALRDRDISKEECEKISGVTSADTIIYGVYKAAICYRDGGGYDEFTEPTGFSCIECNEGHSCAGGTESQLSCRAGTYQPNSGQTTCLTTPAGNFSALGATNYTACPAGQYQPTAGQSACEECPAGSYCATTGLSAVSGVCTDGTFAGAGAMNCSNCPETELTDAENNPIVATTGGDGATSMAACHIGPNTYLKDTKGVYHYKSKCNAYGSFDESNATSAEREERCSTLGGYWNCLDSECEEGYCDASAHYDTNTEANCVSVGGTWSQTGEDEYTCFCTVSFDLSNGNIVCD